MIEDKPLRLSERAYLGAKAVEALENDLALVKALLEPSVSLLEETLRLYPNLRTANDMRRLIKAYRGQ